MQASFRMYILNEYFNTIADYSVTFIIQNLVTYIKNVYDIYGCDDFKNTGYEAMHPYRYTNNTVITLSYINKCTCMYLLYICDICILIFNHLIGMVL